MSLYGVLEEQVGWYEASLSLQERRSRGHFSTPTIRVEHILDACGYHSTTPAADLRSIRVLDPACGSGNFVAAPPGRLISSGVYTSVADDARAPLLEAKCQRFAAAPAASGH